MSVEERLTICNLSIELGAKIGMIAPDDTTFDYLAGPPLCAAGRHVCARDGDWRALPTDEGARFDAESPIDASAIAPQVTWGTSPRARDRGRRHAPRSRRRQRSARRKAMEAALDYMGLTPGAAIEGTPIDWVFIGSCTNCRLSDIRDAARSSKGASRERCQCVGRSRLGGGQTRAEAEARRRVPLAGFEWREPGCRCASPRTARPSRPGERSVSTSNRNFVGRQGPGARTHLASPSGAVAAAIAGAITDVKDF